MNKIAFIGSSLTLSALLAFSSSADAAERIKFARNAVSATISSTLQNHKSKKTYVIKLKQGQTLDIRSVTGSKPITISVTDPKGKNIDDWGADCHSRHQSVTELAGDYTIAVTECLKADAWKGKFTMNVTAIGP